MRSRTGPRKPSALRLPLIGLTFVVILVGLLAAAIADYRGAFTPSTQVTLYVPDAGSQLSKGAQVKLHGAVVGAVDKIEPSSKGAKLTLALDPDKTDLIPVNTVARILPKTLVGQDYVDLVLDDAPAIETISAGDVIERDTSATGATLEGALDSLLDVLQALPPQQVASTLNAVSTALDGRGEQLGETLVSLHDYLTDFNPELPTFTENFRGLTEFSETYSEAAPDLLGAVEDLSTTARTLAEQRVQLDRLFVGVRQATDDVEDFLDENSENLINVVAANRSTLSTLATYAPEYPCLFEQLAGLVPRVDDIFGAGERRPALNITLVVTNSRGKYEPNQDEPVYADSRGPRCYPIVERAPQYPADGPIKDGAAAPPAPEAPRDGDASAPPLAPGSPFGRTPLAGSQAESDLFGALLGDDDASFASLLLGPLLRGSEVSVR